MFRPTLAALAAALILTAPAAALEVLDEARSRERIGDPEKHFLAGTYTYEILTRSHRDAMHGRFSDGVIFNAGGGLFDYPRRKDGNHLVRIDAPGGRQEEPVTAEEWRRKIANVISDDNPSPRVILDESGQEQAVVYLGRGTNFKARKTDDGLIEIEIAVPGGSKPRRRSAGF